MRVPRAPPQHRSAPPLSATTGGRRKSPVTEREYGPGQPGQGRQTPTAYRLQLMAKQRLKGYSGSVSERQLRRYYLEAVRRKGDTGENLIGLLERRLDTVVYRAKFVGTMFAARQVINHGHVNVNGRRVTISGSKVTVGDHIGGKETPKQLPVVLVANHLTATAVPAPR